MLCSKRARLATILLCLVLTAFVSAEAWGMSCEDDSDCNDGKSCTLDLCSGNACEWIADSSACQDGLYCNGIEVCDPENVEADSHGCAQGEPVQCGLGLSACVHSECSEALQGVCVNTPDDSECDDGQACNGAETCDPTEGCLAGTPACSDGWACTTDVCTELGAGNYLCSFPPNHAICADSFYCNGAEQCKPSDPAHNSLGCVMNVPAVNCNDGFACTVDYCSEALDRCMNIADNAYCNDNQFCNGQETCNTSAPGHLANGCLPGTAPNCNDHVGCTDDYCDEDIDVCMNVADNANCDDFNPCTGPDTCHEVNDCYNAMIQDGTGCTLAGGGSGICRSGVCTTGCLKDQDCNDGLACTVDTCNLQTETCQYAPNNSYCDNGLWCDGAESCAPGNPEADSNGCLDGAAPNCVDAFNCTMDSCDEDNNACRHSANNALCDNGVWCDGAEICSLTLGCVAGVAGVEPCNDNVSCTVDNCSENGHSCSNTPSNSLCDDGLWCNGIELCDAENDCQAGEAPNCNDGVNCTNDSCNEDADSCVNVVNNASCNDYNDCTTQYCDAALGCQYSNTGNGGQCQLNPYIQGVCFNGLCQESCVFDEDCPAPDCMTAECVGGLCQFEANDGYCNDGSVCNGVESCNPNHPNAGEDGCVSTVALNCNDGIACTADSCHPVQGCKHVANNALCSDGNYCNGDEVCNVASGCQDAPDPSCDDGIPCTIDSCDNSGGCVHTPQNSLCQDGLYCNGAEICDTELGCIAGAPPGCADSFACTTDTCDEGSKVCRHTPNSNYCNNADYCDGTESCNPYGVGAGADGCVAGSAPDCDDGFDCTLDGCDEQHDNCYHNPQHSYCNDNLFCNGEEACEPSDPLAGDDGCVAGEEVVCNDGISCTADSCDEAGDTCEYTPDHQACDDNLWCNGSEYCSEAAGCYHYNVPSCGDAFACTLDSCDETHDTCAHQVRDWLCADTSVCNGEEKCVVDSGCVAGTPLDCADDYSCTIDSCVDLQGGCVHQKDHAYCGDGLVCNGEEQCEPAAPGVGASGCIAGTAITCEDGVSCTVGACKEMPPNGYYCEQEAFNSLCSDNNDCNGIETCDKINGCKAGEAKICNDFVDCTDDDCNPANGQCINTPNNGNCANSNPCRPLNGCSATGGCLYGELLDGTLCDINPAILEKCLNGFCVPSDVHCSEDNDCDDHIPCTVDTCVDNNCSYQADSGVCQDDLYCNGVEVCVIGVGCQDGPDVNCAEQPVDIACTHDQCEEASDSCSHTPIDNWCDDSFFCNGIETCNPVNGCQAGTPVLCPPDGVSCTVDRCLEDTHACGNIPDDSLCRDGLYCNGSEFCDPVADCRAGVAPIIDDEIPCTIDACEEGANTSDNVGQVTHTPDNSVCLNGLYCDGAETCLVDIGCINGAAPQVDDEVACTTDSCSEGADNSDNVGSIVHTPNNAFCQNGLYCDGAESCHVTMGCQSGSAPQLSDGVPCTVDSCSEGANINDNIGSIAHIPDDALCQDGLYCNGAEICHVTNNCQPGNSPDPDDHIACTDDSCSEGANLSDNLGSLVNVPNDARCQDSDLCNGAEICAPGDEAAGGDGCKAGTEVHCDDGITCTEDSCEPQSGECSFIPDDSLCSDNIVCTFDICDVDKGCRNPPLDDGELCDVNPEVFEVCYEGVCVKGCQQDEDCVDEFDCTTGECDMETLLCRVITDDSLCDNSLYCDGEETCNPELGCMSGEPVDCEHPYTCSYDAYCDEDSDHCIQNDEVGACDDGKVCTIDRCIVEEGCQYQDAEDGFSCGEGKECRSGECVDIGADGDSDADPEEEVEDELEPEGEDGDFDEEAESEGEYDSDGDLEEDGDTLESDGDTESDSEIIEGDGDTDRDADKDTDKDTDKDSPDNTDGDVEVAPDGDESGQGGGGGGCSSADGRAWPMALLAAALFALRRRRSLTR